ncbi:MAG: hypothetical protein KH284_06975 [Clostridiales bacterium]|nr:hypothetical protein [Clostridiales bacterium]
MNRFRFFSSGALLLFSLYCLIFDRTLPFSLPKPTLVIATAYLAFFPVKDMLSRLNRTLYKGRQFAKNYEEAPMLDEVEFRRMKKQYDRRARYAMLFWLAFLAAVGGLYAAGIFDRAWIFFFFAFSDFCVYFAVFFWCPFHRLIVKPSCCMECRIFNWDSFFSYSFLLFLPSVYSVILVGLALCSLAEWEITYHKYPKRFYRMSNQKLTCENCDLEACKNRHKRRFHKELCEAYRQERTEKAGTHAR